MVSYKHYNIDANEDCVKFLTSKLITCFIDTLFTKWMHTHTHTYIWFGTLKVKRTQYGICEEAVFKNAKAMVFPKSGEERWIKVFGRILKCLINLF